MYLVASLRKVWEISWEELQIIKEIGSGAFGVVHSAKWRDLSVAVKSVAGCHLAMNGNFAGSELDKEIAMLQQVRHSNIVLFFGAGTSPDGTPFLVTELVELGTLTSYLAHNRIDWAKKMHFALDTTLGMAHVQSLGRMHRDLKGSNLLVSSSLRVKVADFGTAAIASHTMAPDSHDAHHVSRHRTQRTKGVGTPLWMAPEIIAGKAYGPSADVYSFGIVMWEIAAQAVPWTDVPDSNFFMSKLLELITEEVRPPVDPAWPSAYSSLMARCWATLPSARPSFFEARAELEKLVGK